MAFVLFGSCSQAEAGETQVEIGASQVGSSFSTGGMLTVTERINDKYDFTIGYITDQEFSVCDRPDCTWFVQAQIFAGAELLMSDPWTGKLKLGIGPYIFQRADRIGTDTFRMGLSIEYKFNDRFGVRARHFSLAGSGPNIEICRDPATWRNVDTSRPFNGTASCITNDWNTGQDSWLRAVWYF